MLRKCFVTWSIFLALFRLGYSDRQVTFTCDGEGDGAGPKGDVGAPGKRGSEGPRGFPGPQGQKGNAADVTALIEQVRTLNEEVAQLRRKLEGVPTVYHFRLSNSITWTSSNEHCESLSMVLCTKNKIFHRGLPFGIGVQSGDHWTPIRDRENDWTHIGTGHPLGTDHVQSFGAPRWGNTAVSLRVKGHVFCCIKTNCEMKFGAELFSLKN